MSGRQPPGPNRETPPGHDRRPSRARPYAWTEGRTAPTVDLPIEALIRTTPAGETQPYHRTDPRSLVTRLCREPRSVAEIAAQLAVPLVVVRVLVSDLVNAGQLTVHNTLADNADVAQRRNLLERVLDGLHSR